VRPRETSGGGRWRWVPRAIRRSLEARARDLEMMVRQLRGAIPDPVVRSGVRPPRVAGGARPDAAPRRLLEITAVARETPDSVVLHLRDPAGGSVEHRPGEFLTLCVEVGGREVRRAYSICTPPGDPRGIAVGIKRVPGGLVSNHLNDTAEAGQRVAVLGPSGSFVVTPAAEASRTYLLIAGGSGITPMMAIVGAVLEGEADSRLVLLYGNRRADAVMFREALGQLAQDHPGRLVVRHVLEEPDDLLEHGLGRLDAETLGRELDALGVADGPDVEWLICGPEGMMRSVRAALEGRGVPRARLREERFQSPGERIARVTAPQEVEVRSGADRVRFRVAPGLTVLEAGLAAGAPLPFSCTLGGCGACRVRLVEGDVHLDEPHCLSAEELAAGMVLTCVGRPASPVVLEVAS